jgi:hypothetical protein
MHNRIYLKVMETQIEVNVDISCFVLISFTENAVHAQCRCAGVRLEHEAAVSINFCYSELSPQSPEHSNQAAELKLLTSPISKAIPVDEVPCLRYNMLAHTC